MPVVIRYVGGFCAVALMLAAACGAGANAAVAPEGPRLAFLALNALKPRGFSVDTADTELSVPHVLVRGARRGVVPQPLGGLTWSADGSQVAFAASQGHRNGIYVVSPDGTSLYFLRGTGGGSNPVFSPDGTKIAFARAGKGKFLFSATPWVANADGSGARRLADWREGVDYVPSSFSPDGSILAVTRSEFGSLVPDAWLLPVNKKGGARLLAKQAAEPAFSPDGSYIVLVRYSILRRRKVKSVQKDLDLTSADGMTTAPLTRTPWIAESHPSWDPSGRRIAFDSYRISKDPIEALFDELLPVGNSIVQVNTDGSCRERVLSLGDAALYGAAWQPGPDRGAEPIVC